MPAYDVLFDSTTRQVDVQLATADALAAKAATIFSIASTVAAVVPALLPLGKPVLHFDSPSVRLLILALVAYLSTFGLFLLNYWSSNWQNGPKPSELEKICANHTSEYGRRWAADAYLLSLRLNERKLRRKAIYFGVSVITFVLEVGLLMGAAVATFSH